MILNISASAIVYQNYKVLNATNVEPTNVESVNVRRDILDKSVNVMHPWFRGMIHPDVSILATRRVFAMVKENVSVDSVNANHFRCVSVLSTGVGWGRVGLRENPQ